MKIIERIAINTGGGDAPGLNAVIHAAVHSAQDLGWEILGIRDGLDGLLHPERYPDGGMIPLTRPSVHGIEHLGGTMLGTNNRLKKLEGGEEIVARMRSLQIDALISIGGDGTLSIARELHERGLLVIGVPKTIDNDLDATMITFGFDSAVSFATQCIDRLHFTAESHQRVMVVEVMGRYAGWLALHAGLGGRADAILIPEVPYDIGRVATHLMGRIASRQQDYAMVVVAEGARPVGGTLTLKESATGNQVERLGGVGEVVAQQLRDLIGKEARCVVLGHLLRGGQPTSLDRSLGLIFGASAVRALADGHNGVMIAVNPPRIDHVPLRVATAKLKLVAPNDYGLLAARTLGISFGD